MTGTTSFTPQQGTPRAQPPTSGVASLISGILGLTALPLIGSILALVFGYQSRREAQAEPHRYTDDLGRIGRILGWVGLALAMVGVVLVVLALLFLLPVTVSEVVSEAL